MGEFETRFRALIAGGTIDTDPKKHKEAEDLIRIVKQYLPTSHPSSLSNERDDRGSSSLPISAELPTALLESIAKFLPPGLMNSLSDFFSHNGSLLASVQKQLENTEENLRGQLAKVGKDLQDQRAQAETRLAQSETRLAQSEARLAQSEARLAQVETRLVESDKGHSKLKVGQLAYLYESLLVKTIQLPACVPVSRYPLRSMKDLRDHVEDNKMDDNTRRLIQEQIADTEARYLSRGTKSVLRYLKDKRGPGAHPRIDLGDDQAFAHLEATIRSTVELAYQDGVLDIAAIARQLACPLKPELQPDA